nr:MAG TPA: hypothetical protein [Caudoviricetes sp.]
MIPILLDIKKSKKYFYSFKKSRTFMTDYYHC